MGQAMNNLAIFDLDGVLCHLKDLHYEALNEALVQCGAAAISRDNHLSSFDGLPTSAKLRKLGIEGDLAADISAKKQSLTIDKLPEYVSKDPVMAAILHDVYASGWLIGVCSNARSETVRRCLELLGVEFQVSWQYTPDSTLLRSKPAPEMLIQMMMKADSCPRNTVVFDDSPIGLAAAHASGARVAQVDCPLTREFVLSNLRVQGGYTYQWSDLNVLIPAAGDGQRFADAGYKDPKPFIRLPGGKTMLEGVIDNLGVLARFRLIVRSKHVTASGPQAVGHGKFYQIDYKTRGTAESCLVAAHDIDNDSPLLIANSDQMLEWDSTAFWYFCRNSSLDGVITVFDCPDRNPKWSFCDIGDDGLVRQVVEKKPISDVANCGLWFWRRGSDFVKYAREMIGRDDRVLGEFYAGPVYNLAIADGKRIGTFSVKKMHGLGTPEDLKAYLEYKKA
jgi:HAD superfamily hydrolase (TIGR01509 family)